MLRRAASRLGGLATRAASHALEAAGVDAAAACSSSRAAWLLPPGHRRAAAAACSASPPCSSAAAAGARGICSSTAARHEAAPAEAGGGKPEQRAAAREREQTCWQCGTPLGAEGDPFFCRECGSVQPAAGEPQYFRVFGMEAPQFSVDKGELERRYRDLQRRLHPDKYSTASSLEQEYAHQQAAVVNQAYDVLKKPLRRAHYILNQAGKGACEGMTITDPELLMAVMEAREEVEEAGSDRGRLQPLLDRMRAYHDSTVEELAAAFGGGDMDRAAELTTQLRYICRIKEAIIDKM